MIKLRTLFYWKAAGGKSFPLRDNYVTKWEQIFAMRRTKRNTPRTPQALWTPSLLRPASSPKITTMWPVNITDYSCLFLSFIKMESCLRYCSVSGFFPSLSRWWKLLILTVWRAGYCHLRMVRHCHLLWGSSPPKPFRGFLAVSHCSCNLHYPDDWRGWALFPMLLGHLDILFWDCLLKIVGPLESFLFFSYWCVKWFLYFG